MADNPIAAEMRLYALELLCSSHFAALHSREPNPTESLAELRRFLIQKTRQNPFPLPDPALSDMTSGELEEAFERLLRIQAALLGVDLPKGE